MPEQGKAFVKNSHARSLEDSDREMMVSAFAIELGFLNSLMPYELEVGGLEKVKHIGGKPGELHVKSKKGEVLPLKLTNADEYDSSKRFWVRVSDWEGEIVKAEFVPSEHYRSL